MQPDQVKAYPCATGQNSGGGQESSQVAAADSGKGQDKGEGKIQPKRRSIVASDKTVNLNRRWWWFDPWGAPNSLKPLGPRDIVVTIVPTDQVKAYPCASAEVAPAQTGGGAEAAKQSDAGSNGGNGSSSGASGDGGNSSIRGEVGNLGGSGMPF